MALANAGALIASWGYKVLCVDWDLEAPGLHIYFRGLMDQKNADGLLDLVEAFRSAGSVDWRRYLTDVRLPNGVRNLDLITAGRRDDSYVRRVQEVDWQALYDKHRFGNFLETMRGEWIDAYDFILVDSRTGITDIGGICTVALPDTLVLLFTANDQNLEGVADFTNRVIKERDRLPFDRYRLQVLPVAARFDLSAEYERTQDWLSKFARQLEPFYADWTGWPAKEVLNQTRIPYIPYWSFGEGLPAIERGTVDPQDVGHSLGALAALIRLKLSAVEAIGENVQLLIKQARGPHRVLLLADSEDTLYRDELAERLKPLEQAGHIRVVKDLDPDPEWRSQEYNVDRGFDLMVPFMSPKLFHAHKDLMMTLMRVERLVPAWAHPPI